MRKRKRLEDRHPYSKVGPRKEKPVKEVEE